MARDFCANRGAKPQAYFVYGKVEQRRAAQIDPSVVRFVVFQTCPSIRENQKKNPAETLRQDHSGGGRWIRTTEGIASRFTVCPLWPLGNSPIFSFLTLMELVDGLEPPTC